MNRTARLCLNITFSTAAIWLLGAGTAMAADQGDLLPYTPVAPSSINVAGMILQLVISLVVVIGLAIILIKFLQRNSLLSRQGTWARVVDQVSVGTNKTLVLAEIFGKVYVLGVTDHGITNLLGENDIDLSLVQQVFADAENRKRLPSYIGNSFLNILDSRIEDLRKRYKWKDGSPR